MNFSMKHTRLMLLDLGGRFYRFFNFPLWRVSQISNAFVNLTMLFVILPTERRSLPSS